MKTAVLLTSISVLNAGCGSSGTPRDTVPSIADSSILSGDTPAGIDNELVDIDFGGNSFQIFSYEASIVEGVAVSRASVVPAVSLTFDAAKAACEAAEFRLCTQSEWNTACRGPDDLQFGFAEDAPGDLTELCDVARTENNTPGSLPSKTGSHSQCKTNDLELYDVVGNAAEWAETDDGVALAIGAAFYQAAAESDCEASITGGGATMEPETQSTDVGFRCCK